MKANFTKISSGINHLGGKAKSLVNLPSSFYFPTSYIFNAHELWSLSPFKSEIEKLPSLNSKDYAQLNFEELKEKIHQYYLKLDFDLSELEDLKYPLIIRSNMAAEDLKDFSAAGLYESIKINSQEELISTIAKVISSFCKSDILKALLAAKYNFEDFYPAILIQEYQSFDYSGVYFSRNPAKPYQKQGYIEVSKGQVENITDGVLANCYSENDAFPKEYEFLSQVFLKFQILEKKFKYPLDIEWGLKDDELVILQVRPITDEDIIFAFNLKRGQKFDRSVTLERFPERISPLGWSALQSAFKLNLKVLKEEFGIISKTPSLVAVSNQYAVYTDPNFFNFPSGVKIDLLKIFNPFKILFWKIILLLYLFPILIILESKHFIKLLFLRVFFSDTANNIIRLWPSNVESFKSEIQSLKNQIQTAEDHSEQELLGLMDKTDQLTNKFLYHDLPIYLIKESYFNGLNAYLKNDLALPQNQVLKFFGNIQNNVTRKMNQDLNKFKTELENDPNKDDFLVSFDSSKLTHAKEHWDNFLKLNGHIINSWDIKTPTWSEDPSQIKSFLSMENKSLDDISFSYPNRFPKFIHQTISETRSLMEIDEEQHFLSGALLGVSRLIIDLCAKKLLNHGLIENNEQIFYLELDEIKSALNGNLYNLSYCAELRKNKFNRLNKTPINYELKNYLDEKNNEEQTNSLGLGVSSGVAKGKIKFVSDISDMPTDGKDTIIIVKTPNPVFSPGFSEIAGIISESGTFLSHGFITAREYLTPAISQIQNTQDIFNEGDLVQINGNSGEFQILNRESNE